MTAHRKETTTPISAVDMLVSCSFCRMVATYQHMADYLNYPVLTNVRLLEPVQNLSPDV
jgi:hypothetical protein